MNPPVAGMTCTQAIGGHFNPFNVQLMGNYSTYCSPQTPLRCESGDLGNKHGRLAISQPSPDRVTYSYVDNNLNLFGPTNYSSKSDFCVTDFDADLLLTYCI